MCLLYRATESLARSGKISKKIQLSIGTKNLIILPLYVCEPIEQWRGEGLHFGAEPLEKFLIKRHNLFKFSKFPPPNFTHLVIVVIIIYQKSL